MVRRLAARERTSPARTGVIRLVHPDGEFMAEAGIGEHKVGLQT
jgi:hypothetical protein